MPILSIPGLYICQVPWRVCCLHCCSRTFFALVLFSIRNLCLGCANNIFQPYVNLTDLSWWSTPSALDAHIKQGTGLNVFSDPRNSFGPFIAINNPSNPGNPTLTDCCKTTFLDFFVDCFTYGRTCPVIVSFMRNINSIANGAWYDLKCVTVFCRVCLV
jgi:hypothetical protein